MRILRIILISFLILGLMEVPMIVAQEAPAAQEGGEGEEAPKRKKVKPPVMKSVFWNTLLGSAWGALMGAAGALTQPDFSFGSLRESLVVGTTFGGLVGYGFGVFLVLRGISFDPSRIPMSEGTEVVAAPMVPVYQVALGQNSQLHFGVSSLFPGDEGHKPMALLQTRF